MKAPHRRRAVKAKYKRILLKISGEALSGEVGHGFDKNALNSVAKQIREVADLGVEVGVVVGGGNIWRGRQGLDMDRVRRYDLTADEEKTLDDLETNVSNFSRRNISCEERRKLSAGLMKLVKLLSKYKAS